MELVVHTASPSAVPGRTIGGPSVDRTEVLDIEHWSKAEEEKLRYCWERIANGEADITRLAIGGVSWGLNPLHAVISIKRALQLETTRCDLVRELDRKQYLEISKQADSFGSQLWDSCSIIRDTYRNVNFLKLHMLWLLAGQVDLVKSDLEQMKNQKSGSIYYLRNKFVLEQPDDPQEAYFNMLVTAAAAQDDLAAVCVALSMPILEEGMVDLYSNMGQREKDNLELIEKGWQEKWQSKVDLLKAAAQVVTDNRANGKLALAVPSPVGSASVEVAGDLNLATMEREVINWYGVKVIRELFDHYNLKPKLGTQLPDIKILSSDSIRRFPNLAFVHNSRQDSVEVYEVVSKEKLGYLLKLGAFPEITYNALQRAGHTGIYALNFRIMQGKLRVRPNVKSEGDGFVLPKLKHTFYSKVCKETIAETEYRDISPNVTSITERMTAALKKCGIAGGCWRTVTEGKQPVRDTVEVVPSTSEAWTDGFREVDGATIIAALGGWFPHNQCEKAAWWQKVPVAGSMMSFGHCASQRYSAIDARSKDEAYRITVFAAENGLIWHTAALLGGQLLGVA